MLPLVFNVVGGVVVGYDFVRYVFDDVAELLCFHDAFHVPQTVSATR